MPTLRPLLTTSAILAALAPVPVLAQAADDFTLEEIIVTATKMGDTRLQETPIAITAFTADSLEKTGMKDIRDLAGSTPNLVIAQNGAFSQIYIRGIGSNNVFAGSDPSTTMHVDGVYIARPAAAFSNFLDVERIEVLRGPQGTLYGRNSVGGTINVVSRLPDQKVRAKAQATIGNYDLYRGEAYVSGPLVEDRLYGSVSVMGSKHDGYFKNVVASGNDRASEDTWGARAILRATPNEALDIVFRADYMADYGHSVGNQALLQPFRPVAGGPVDPITEAIRGDWHKVAVDSPSNTDRKVKGMSAEITYSLSDAMELKSLTAYRKSDMDYITDTDATHLRRQETRQREFQDQWSQELNLSGRVDKFKYVVGLYYFDEHIDTNTLVIAYNLNRVTNPAPTVDTKAWAGYGQGSYDVTDQFTLTSGIRYTDEKKTFDQSLNIYTLTTGVPLATYPRLYLNEGKYTAWTPKFGAEFKVDEDVMLYASATRGFKSGGFNFSSANVAQGFAPETLWSYEAGFKTEFADKRVRLNGSVFTYDYNDLQVQSFLSPGVVDITNASDAKVDGVELELTTRPVSGLEIGGSLTWLDAKYKNYPQAPVPGATPVVTIDASGKYLNSAPKWAYSLYGQYSFDLGGGSAFVRGEYGWKDRQYFTLVNDAIQTMGSYDLINASFGYSPADSNWQVIVYGRNLSDTQYLVSTGTFTAVPSGTPGDPRTYGIRLTYSY
ncbi:TonB-dependent receptor [Niveispirillum sp. KHB5.9]|uniref:TonB-dependent receptor n=1 Tax=Niveispirillum sp. KHB5.9 TaxID=3400269 RepID=UPI003A8A5B4E